MKFVVKKANLQKNILYITIEKQNKTIIYLNKKRPTAPTVSQKMKNQ